MATPVALQTTPATPNGIYVPNLILGTSIVNGRLVTMAHITLAAASVDSNGNYAATGQVATLVVQDILNLDADVASLASQVNSAYASLISIINEINGIRKVL